MNSAAGVHCLLAEDDAASSVSEMPIEDRHAALEAMSLASRIDDELQGNVVRRAAVSEHRLCPDGATVVRDHGLLECRLLTKHFARSRKAGLRHDDCSSVSRQNAEISVSVDADRFIGFGGRRWSLAGGRCLRSRWNGDEPDHDQDNQYRHGSSCD